MAALRRKIRSDAGRQRAMGVELRRAVQAQYEAHPSWSAQLHYNNLVTLAESSRELEPVPSYWTVRRSCGRTVWCVSARSLVDGNAAIWSAMIPGLG